jgi:hypothetical protein
MKTFNTEDDMKTQIQSGAETAEAVGHSRRHGITPLKRRVNETRTAPAALLALLLLLVGWLALPARALAQPADYTNETDVANYVNGILYWSPGSPNNSTAAFRYLTLLYTNDGGVAPNITNMPNLYGDAERALAQTAEGYVVTGLANNPNSTLLAGLLLDIYYNRTGAEFILAANSLDSADLTRMGPPSVAGGLVIDDEIALYQQVIRNDASVLMAHFSLLTNTLGMTNVPPAGYQWLQQLEPDRDLDPATYLSDDLPVSVTGDTTPLFNGYKDLVLLFSGLRDYGRTAVTLARLQWARNNSGDLAAAKSLIGDSQRFLFLETTALLALFPGIDPHDTNQVDAASGLAEGVDGVNECLGELEGMRQTIVGGGNLLGFQSDFLMLVQHFPGQSGTVYDSFDSFQLQLDPSNLSSPLSYAQTLLAQEESSYDQYRATQDQLNSQLQNINESTDDRLFQIVGAYPGDPAYSTPQDNEGSEIWQQVQSIQEAVLRIQNDRVQMNDLKTEVQIEYQNSQLIENVDIQFGNTQADLDQWIGHISAIQAGADALADAVGDAEDLDFAGAAADAVNAVVQAACEEIKGQLEAVKDEDAAIEQANIEILNTWADVQTKLLGLNTLAVDAQEDAVQLSQAMGQLVALQNEKANLERTLAENQQNLSQRYFADPIHHLRYQQATLLANLSFNEAQKWLFYMGRALEYKWNTPFTNYSYMGRSWATSTLFALRNAEELTQFYNAMVSFDSLVQLPTGVYWDWFSVREDFFGYAMYDATGTNLLYYPDPANPTGPTNLTAVQAFQRTLKGLTNSQGTITLNFSTVRQIPGGTFFLGPRFDPTLQTVESAGLCLDKIIWIEINLPGNHTLGRSTLAGNLTYGGTSFIRNFNVGSFVPGQPNLMTNEMTAYSTRYWFFDPVTASWQFSEALTSPVTMTLTNNSMMPPTVGEINVFQERSVATSGWVLTIPTWDLGQPVLDIDELDDVQLYFYHYAVSRETPEGQ